MPDLIRRLTHSRRLRRLALLVAFLAASDRALHGQTAPPHTLYFAEGATGFFTTSIDLVNPSASDTATATVTFVGDSGPVGTRTITLAPRASQSISLNAEVGAVAPAGTVGGFGTIVESNIELAGERHMSWGEGGYGSSLERGVRQASTTWYFAEGATSVFDLYYLLLNPGTTAAEVTIKFLREDGPPVIRTVRVAPRSRSTLRVLDFSDPELQAASFGAVLTSTVPIVAEQAMYQSSPTQHFGAGSASAATPTLATTAHFAEGATGFFDEFLLLINPSPSAAATATMRYRLPDGTTLSKAYAIQPERRLTVWLNQEAQSDPALSALASTAVAVTVTSDLPIAVTRKMYWPSPLQPVGWGEASDAAGITTTTLRAYIARAMVGGPDQAATYVLVANTSADAGQIQMTVRPAGGTPVVQTYPIAGNARLTVDLAWFEIVDQPFSVVIESLANSPAPAVPIVVEVASYSSPGGQFWASGSTSAASVPETPPGDGAPTLTSVSPNQGIRGTTVAVTLTGAGFVAGATTVAVAGGGVTVTGVVVGSSTSLTANFVIDPAAAEGPRSVTVTTAGTSGAQVFTVTVPLPPGTPTLTSVTPNEGIRGTTVAVTMTGTNFITGATTVTVGGSGVTVTNVAVSSETSLTASFVLDPTAAEGPRTVTVTTAIGTSGPRIFTINLPAPSAPTLTSVTPNEGDRGTTVAVTLTGTGFTVGATTVSVSGGGVTVTNVVASSGTSLTADFVLDPAAVDGPRPVTVTTAAGTSGAQTFTIDLPPPPGTPTLTSVSPNQGVRGTSVPVTLIGTDFVVGATTVTVGGSGVTVTDVVVGSTTSLTANFVLDQAATASPRAVTVTTAGGTSAPRGFTINLSPPTLTSVSPNSGIRGETVAVTLTGTNFVVGATTVAVAGGGVTVTNVIVGSATSLTASFVLDLAAAGARTVTVTTAGGTSAGQTFTIDLPAPGSATFTYTGGEQLFTVPAGVVAITIDATGAVGGKGGGASTGLPLGMGGRTTATVSVVPGALLTVRVGGSGPDGQSPSTAGGFNGGGASAGNGGGGGGASSVRDGSIPLVIAGGGGGGGGSADILGGVGGAGGGLTAAAGGSVVPLGGGGGGGATQAAGGGGGTRGNPGGTDGSAGIAGTGGAGGIAVSTSPVRAGGGGGGGYFGGGGGGGGGGGLGDIDGGGGGGGSSFAAPGATGVVHQQGVNIGAGSVTISWQGGPP